MCHVICHSQLRDSIYLEGDDAVPAGHGHDSQSRGVVINKGSEKIHNDSSLALVADQTSVSLKQVSTQGTTGVIAGAEPLVQTRRVELLLASPTRQLGQRVVSPVEDVETDVAFLKKYN